jgi:trimeric autotransporter adhesin
MKIKFTYLFIMMTMLATIQQAAAQGTAFTYQGRLNTGNTPANGNYDLAFTLYNSSGGGNIAGPVTNSATTVSNGVFTTTIDFGAPVFNGSAVWLGIAVRTNGNGTFTALMPYEQVIPTPYAITAQNLAGVVLNNVINGDGETIGGGNNNATSNYNSTISGGAYNAAYGYVSSVGGGSGNQANSDYSTVGGGLDNVASNINATVGGGYLNTASGAYATAVGGFKNVASGVSSTVMGIENTASGVYSTALGYQNTTSGMAAIVMGEYSTASGEASAAIGYQNTTSGAAAIALGAYAQATQDNTFVWGDGSSATPFVTSGANQFIIRAFGGVGIGTANPQASLHVYSDNNPTVVRIQSTGQPGFGRIEFVSNPQTDANQWRPAYIQSLDEGGFTGGLGFYVNGTGAANKFGSNEVMRIVNGNVGIGNTAPGNLLVVGGSGSPAYCNGTTWVNGSDRNSKEAFAAINPRTVLEKVSALPITEWKYKAEAGGTENLGPMAQDFHAAFGLNGADDKHIATVDEEGVALAAIQGLNQKLEKELNRQDAENADLKQRLAKLEKIVLNLKSN